MQMNKLKKVYKNLRIFLTDYRNYRVIGDFYDDKKFEEDMNMNYYLMHECINELNGKPLYIYLFHRDNYYTLKKKDMLALVNKKYGDKYKRDKTKIDIIFITEKLTKIAGKMASDFPNAKLYNYTFVVFALVIPLGPTCSRHVIIDDREKNDVLNFCGCSSIDELPKILVGDPQVIWSGAVEGDVLRISYYSPRTGEAIYYRTVSKKIAINEDDEDNLDEEGEEEEESIIEDDAKSNLDETEGEEDEIFEE